MDARNITVLFILVLIIVFLSYGLYELQFIMHFDNAEKVAIENNKSEYSNWLFSNFIIASVLAILFIILTYPLIRLLKSKNITHLKVLMLLFLVVFVSFFGSGIGGSVIGYNSLVKGTLHDLHK